MTYNDIEFDDYSTSGGLWSHVCEKHAGQFDKPLLSSDPNDDMAVDKEIYAFLRGRHMKQAMISYTQNKKHV